MPRRPVIIERGRQRGRAQLVAIQRELRDGRLDRGLSQSAVARSVGVDRSWVSQVERGVPRDLGVIAAAELLAAVGLELAVRAYPVASPVRDKAHLALIASLRSRIHRSLSFAVEAPFPQAGDLRAWDATVAGNGWRIGVEAETRPRDIQALERRLSVKARDGDVENVLLVLLDSRGNRQLLREHARDLAGRFPLPGRVALERLAGGFRPGADAIVLLKAAGREPASHA